MCRLDGVIPSATCEAAQPALADLNGKVAPLVEQYIALMEKIKLKDGIRMAMNVSFAGNKFLQVRFLDSCSECDSLGDIPGQVFGVVRFWWIAQFTGLMDKVTPKEGICMAVNVPLCWQQPLPSNIITHIRSSVA